jgi:general secretion pathway protein I
VKKLSRGFTLLEVMMAMVLLSIALVMLSESWGAAFTRVKKTQISFELAALLERKMDDYERKYKGKSIDEIQDEEADDFGDEYPQYSWKMTSKKFEFPDIASTLTARDGGVDTMTQTVIKQMTDQISKAVKEVTITVIYKHPKKPIEVNATTYFIDYDKPLNLTGPTGI